MFERFTDRARRVVVLAQEEARMLNHNYIGTEHILLGLLAERESVAARALSSLDISLGAAREQVREIIGEGQQSPSGHVPFTPRAALGFSPRSASTSRAMSSVCWRSVRTKSFTAAPTRSSCRPTPMSWM